LFVVFLVSLIGSATVSIVAGPPQPMVHDEFSYVLAADTYSRGRLANPVHSHWEHFESLHIIQQPSYASKYQPAQGLLLAVGQRVAGQPLLGVWLGTAVMAAAILWMLQGWLPPRWALFGGLVAALQFGVVGIWAQSYWGGAVAAAGGAIVFGASRRFFSDVSVRNALILGLGALILAFSRPFEGLVVVLIATTALLLTAATRQEQRLTVLKTIILPLTGVAVLGAVLFSGFNRAVTGDPWTMPYEEHSLQYDAVPLFLWMEPPAPPEYRHDRLAAFHTEWEPKIYGVQRSPGGWVAGFLVRPVVATLNFGFGPPKGDLKATTWVPGLLLLPFLFILHLWNRAWSRRALLAVLALFTCLSAVTYFLPHYVAVVAALWMFLTVEAFRVFRVLLRRRKAIARAMVPGALLYTAILAGISAYEQHAFTSRPHWFYDRTRIAEDLAAGGGTHLVLVRYDEEYEQHAEWVYNSADIDTQAVVWARAMNESSDASLIEYYGDRATWLLTLAPDEPPLLEPLRESGPSAADDLSGGTYVAR
jgi:hypothetical protein